MSGRGEKGRERDGRDAWKSRVPPASGRCRDLPHLLASPHAECRRAHASVQTLHLRGMLDPELRVLDQLRVAKRRAPRVERATHRRLHDANGNADCAGVSEETPAGCSWN